MGVTSLLLSVWRTAADSDAVPATASQSASRDKPPPLQMESRISQDSSIASLDDRDAHDHHAAAAASPGTAQPAACAPPARHRCRRVNFALSKRLYRWLEAMAVRHNYGSVHKSVRDLLEWARTGDEADMEWLFGSSHALPTMHDGWAEPKPRAACFPAPAQKCGTDEGDCADEVAQDARGAAADDDDHDDDDGPVPADADCIARGCMAASACASPQGPVVLDAFIGESAFLWVTGCARRFALHGPSAVLDAVIRVVIELGAADDVFESDECGHDLAVSTAELYRDLGIFGMKPLVPVATSAATSPVMSPR